MKPLAVVIGSGLMTISAIVIFMCLIAEFFTIYPFITLVIGFVLVYFGTKNPEEFFPDECDKGKMY